MTTKHKHPEEQPLANAIRVKNAEKGAILKDTAKTLGISYIHMSSLMRGERSFAGLDAETQNALAKYLVITKGQLLVLAGTLTKDDLLTTSFDDKTEQTFQKIKSDSRWNTLGLGQQDIDSASMRLRLFIALIYEKLESEKVCSPI